MSEGRRRLSEKTLDIIPIQIKNEKCHPQLNPILPQHEFSMLIVAPKGSGKTNFICNLIMNHYKGYFHQIWVCSPTIDNDEKWEYIKTCKHLVVENKDIQKILTGIKKKVNLPKIVTEPGKPDVVKFEGKIPKEDFFSDMREIPQRIFKQNKIISNLKAREIKHSKFMADRILVIMDDQAGLFKGGNNSNPMVNYVIKHRHSNTSVIVVTQAYKAIPKTIRTNCNALILFDIPNLSELKVIYEENPESMDEETWMKVFRYCTEKPYSFMYINNKFPKKETVYRNFIELVRPDIQCGQLHPPTDYNSSATPSEV